MGFLKVKDIVWDNTPFHWAILILVFISVAIEVILAFQYCQTESQGINSIRRNKNNKKEPPKITQWKSKHFRTNRNNELITRDSKFVVIKYPSALARPVPRSSLRFVSTLCTAIGVLGTFYGIQQGLQGITLDTSSSAELMASSKELLMGMGTAFSTSLMGLGSGSFFTVFLFVTDLLRQKRRDKLRDKLDKIASPETADNDNRQLERAINQVANQLTNLNSPSAEAIGNAVGEKIRAAIVPGLQAILQEQQRLREIQENQGQQVLQQLIRDLRVEVIEPLAQRLDESASVTREASNAVQTLHQELGGISQSLASSIQTIQDFQRSTLVELQEFSRNLQQTLSQFQTDTKGVLEQTGKSINDAVSKSIEGMTAQRTAFEDSAENAANTFRGIREELQQSLQERAEIEQQTLQSTRTGIIHILSKANAAFQQQTGTLQTVGQEASGLMNDARENLLATLGNIDQTLQHTRETVQEDLTQFREEYQSNLKTFFEQQNNLLEESLGEQRNGLSEVVTKLDSVFQEEYQRRSQLSEEVNNSMNRISQAAKDVNQLAIATGLNSAERWKQMQEISHGIGEQALGIRQEYGQLTSTFQASLQAWIGHFKESQQHFFKEADNSMSTVCSKLLHTAEVLVEINQNHYNGNGRQNHG